MRRRIMATRDNMADGRPLCLVKEAWPVRRENPVFGVDVTATAVNGPRKGRPGRPLIVAELSASRTGSCGGLSSCRTSCARRRGRRGSEAFLLERAAKLRLIVGQRLGETVTDRAGLAGGRP